MTHICLICHIRLHISLIQEHRSQDPACTRDPGRAHCTLTRTGRDRVRAIGGPSDRGVEQRGSERRGPRATGVRATSTHCECASGSMHQGMRTRMPRSPPGARLCAPAAQPRRAAVDAAQSAREDSSDDILMKDRTTARRTRTRGRGPRRRRTGRRWTGRRRSRWWRWRRTGRRRTRWRGAVAMTVATVAATDDSACRTGHRRAVKQLTGGSGPTYDRLRGR